MELSPVLPRTKTPTILLFTSYPQIYSTCYSFPTGVLSQVQEYQVLQSFQACLLVASHNHRDSHVSTSFRFRIIHLILPHSLMTASYP